MAIDIGLQHELEGVLISHRARLLAAGASQAAAVIVDNRTREILALAGSLAYGPEAMGFVNGAAARRSAGSTLKPFLYARAIERGYAPATVLDDFEQAFRSESGEYLPLNFDRRSNGPVDLRQALGRSLNLPAVHLLDRLGLDELYAVFGELALLPPAAPPPEHYGLGLAVGNLEIRLTDLAAAFATLANGGDFLTLRVLLGEPMVSPRRVFEPATAFLVTDILSDPLLRSSAFAARGLPAPVALKTGTSTRYRDAWTAGYTDRYTVAVWVGNFDGRETAKLFGGEGAGPVFVDLVKLLHGSVPPAAFAPPDGVVRTTICAQSGALPGPACSELKSEYFVRGAEPRATCAAHGQSGRTDLPARYAGWLQARHAEGREGRYRLEGLNPDLDTLFEPEPPAAPVPYTGLVRIGAADSAADAPDAGVRILYPLDEDRYLIERGEDRLEVRLQAATRLPLARVRWFVDGEELGGAGPPYTILWQARRGRHRVLAVDEGGRGEEIAVTVE